MEAAMTLQQMSTLKRWHQSHPRNHGLEGQLWDVMLTCWLLGWIGLAPAALLQTHAAIAVCLLLYLAPTLYVALRRHLHQRGRLRCDWLDSVR